MRVILKGFSLILFNLIVLFFLTTSIMAAEDDFLKIHLLFSTEGGQSHSLEVKKLMKTLYSPRLKTIGLMATDVEVTPEITKVFTMEYEDKLKISDKAVQLNTDLLLLQYASYGKNQNLCLTIIFDNTFKKIVYRNTIFYGPTARPSDVMKIEIDNIVSLLKLLYVQSEIENLEQDVKPTEEKIFKHPFKVADNESTDTIEPIKDEHKETGLYRFAYGFVMTKNPVENPIGYARIDRVIYEHWSTGVYSFFPFRKATSIAPTLFSIGANLDYFFSIANDDSFYINTSLGYLQENFVANFGQGTTQEITAFGMTTTLFFGYQWLFFDRKLLLRFGLGPRYNILPSSTNIVVSGINRQVIFSDAGLLLSGEIILGYVF